MKYKVSTYRDADELEKALNTMDTEGYTPMFVQRSSTGMITVVYTKA